MKDNRPAAPAVLLALLLSLCFTACVEKEESADDPGVPFYSEAGKFSVVFPSDLGVPEKATEQMDSPWGPVTMHVMTTTADEGFAMTACTDYPASVVDSIDPTPRRFRLLNRAATAAAAKMGFSIYARIPVAMAGDTGMETYSSGTLGGSEAYMRARYVFVGSRLYQVALAGDSEQRIVRKTAERFFSSFNVLDLPGSENDSTASDSTVPDSTASDSVASRPATRSAAAQS